MPVRPGFLLVRACVERGVEVQCLPGPTAFVPALVDSGLPCDRFCFEGFLPQKKGRATQLAALASEERTMVFYESPHRMVKTLQQMSEVFDPRGEFVLVVAGAERDKRKNKEKAKEKRTEEEQD